MSGADVAPLGPDVADPSPVEVHAELKSFNVVGFPYANEAAPGWPTGPYGQAVLDGRLRLRLALAPRWRLEAHQELAVELGDAASALGSTGVATGASELVALGFRVEGDATVNGRVDRLLVQGEVGPVTLSFGRQPISQGSGVFFTPVDLVAPFTPATIDSEYKPGVDAVRATFYAGLAFQQELAAAWVGECALPEAGCAAGLDDLALASSTRLTVGVTDVTLLLGEVRDDEVVGLSVVSSVGATGLHGDAALTLPPGHLDDATPAEDPFVRAVVGVDLRPGPDTGLSAEVYVQTNGAAEAGDYAAVLADERHLRGELWAAGRYYAAVSLSHQVLPRLGASLAVLANLQDPSAMLLPGVAVSVAENVDLSAGAWIGAGARPEGYELRSELGVIPVTAFARVAVYAGSRR